MNDHVSQDNAYIMDASGGAEMARLIDQDTLITKAIGLFPAEVDLVPIRHILDIACGPGGWAREVARLFPDANVTGIDLHRDMIRYASAFAAVTRLQNIAFRVMDATQPLAFPDASFDLVNARFLFAFVSRAFWPSLVQEYARLVRPGGVVVLTETDKFCTTNSAAVETFLQLIIDAMLQAGYYAGTSGSGVTPRLATFLHDAGLTAIQTTQHVVPFASTDPTCTSLLDNLRVTFQVVQPFLLKMGTTTQDELTILYDQAIQESKDQNFAGHLNMTTVWGARPPLQE